MIRIALAAALLSALPAAPAFAGAAEEAHGAAAGRSPHKAYRQVMRDDAGCRPVAMHVPGGKMSTYGLNAMPQSTCAHATTLAAAETRGTARD